MRLNAMKSGVQPLSLSHGISLRCGLNAMKSGVQRKFLRAFCEVLPRLNAMKSGVQPRTHTHTYQSTWMFECDEERSATKPHDVYLSHASSLNAMKSGVQRFMSTSETFSFPRLNAMKSGVQPPMSECVLQALL